MVPRWTPCCLYFFPRWSFRHLLEHGGRQFSGTEANQQSVRTDGCGVHSRWKETDLHARRKCHKCELLGSLGHRRRYAGASERPRCRGLPRYLSRWQVDRLRVGGNRAVGGVCAAVSGARRKMADLKRGWLSSALVARWQRDNFSLGRCDDGGACRNAPLFQFRHGACAIYRTLRARRTRLRNRRPSLPHDETCRAKRADIAAGSVELDQRTEEVRALRACTKLR